ncbi:MULTISPECIES: sensor histidine kinase [Acidobacterium]|nr:MULTISPECIES: sensor histidine kinase [Acidobacterium]
MNRMLLIFLVLLMWGAVPGLLALNPGTMLSQYAHAAWRLQGGLLDSPPSAIAQTRDGYIWIGSRSGLLRFDGVSFHHWQSPAGQVKLRDPVVSLLGAQDDSLWIGTVHGLFHWKEHRLIAFPRYVSRIDAIAEGSNGTIWLARSRLGMDRRGPLCRVSGEKVHCFGVADGVPFDGGSALAVDAAGAVWMGGVASILRYSSDGHVSVYPMKSSILKGLPSAVSCLSADPSGGVWVGIAYAGPGLGLEYFENGRYSSTHVPAFASSRLRVTTTYRDRSGSLWVGTSNDGLYRIEGHSIQHYSSLDGLSSNDVHQFMEDAEGDLWVITSNGIDRFRDLAVTTYSLAQHLSSNEIDSVFTSRDGSVWSLSDGGINVLKRGVVTAVRLRRQITGKQLEASLEDREGRVWIAMDKGLYLYSQGRFLPVTRRSGKPIGPVLSMAQDPAGLIWCVSLGHGDNKLFHFDPATRIAEPAGVQQAYLFRVIPDIHQGVWTLSIQGEVAHLVHGKNADILEYKLRPPGKQVSTILQGTGGTLYIWSTSGLTLVRGSRHRFLPGISGDACLHTYSDIFDRGGNMWVASRCGITRYAARDVKEWWRASKLTFHHPLRLGPSDGVAVSGPVFTPAVSRSADGRLWFATDNGLQTLDPADLSLNANPPPVFVERLLADHHVYPLANLVRLPARSRDLEIDYTALSFPSPRKVFFRYRLRGYDDGWQNAGTRRQAFYTNLEPGKYSFQVIACNNSGVWNQQGAALNFIVMPAWYQMPWFRFLAVLAILGILTALYLRRVSLIEREMTLRFSERMTERMRIARELHDTLLQAMQGLVLSISSFSSQAVVSSEVREELERSLDHADRLLVSGRNRIRDLRGEGGESETLLASLSTLVSQIFGSASSKVRFTCEGIARPIHAFAREEVLMIASEALSNACFHSDADEVQVQVSYHDNAFRIAIRDNGNGFDAGASPEGHFGIRGMRERAADIGAHLEVQSAPGHGTEVCVTVAAERAYEQPSGWLRRRFRRLRH